MIKKEKKFFRKMFIVTEYAALNGTIFCSPIVLAKDKRFILETFQKNSKGLFKNSSSSRRNLNVLEQF